MIADGVQRNENEVQTAFDESKGGARKGAAHRHRKRLDQCLSNSNHGPLPQPCAALPSAVQHAASAPRALRLPQCGPKSLYCARTVGPSCHRYRGLRQTALKRLYAPPNVSMPGVPSGKGCDACRKQKKKVSMPMRLYVLQDAPLTSIRKCDLGKPSCSRCARLRIPCIGAGQQRYKFKDQSRSVQRMNSDSSTEKHSSESATPDPSSVGQGRSLSRSPSNEITVLASALVQAMRPETSWRFNIAFTYGGFLTLIPPRLGRNAALDASVSVLTEAHADFCNGQPASRSVLSKYSQALTKLRICLNDPQVATQSDTLCSVMLLLITQVSDDVRVSIASPLMQFHRASSAQGALDPLQVMSSGWQGF